MGADSVQAIVEALREAGTALGTPAVEAAVAYIRVKAIASIACGLVGVILSVLLLRYAVSLVRSDPDPDSLGGRSIAGAILCLVGGLALFAFFAFTLDNVGPAMEPLGALVSKAIQ